MSGPLFFCVSAQGQKACLGSPRFQRQPLTSFEEAAPHTPSPRRACSPLICGAQRSCVRGCSRGVRCTRRRPCHMTPLRGKRPSAWLTRVWHACTWHQTLCRRKARRLMLRAGAAHVLPLRWPCLPVAMHTTAAVSASLARLKAGDRLSEEKTYLPHKTLPPCFYRRRTLLSLRHRCRATPGQQKDSP